MKQFSNKEKQIIRYIVAHRDSNTFILANVFNEWFDKKGVTFDLETGLIKYDYNRVKDVNTILNDEHGIIEIALLIKYLEEKQYIYIIKDKKDIVDSPMVLGANSAETNLAHDIPDDIVSIIKRTLFRVFVAYDLVYIVENNFQTKETQQLALAVLQLKESQQQQKLAEQQLEISQGQLNIAAGSLNEAHFQSDNARITTRISIVTCAVAVLTLLATLLIPCCSSCSCNKEYGIEHPEEYAVELDIKVVNSQLEKTNAYLLQLIEQTNNLTNNFSIKPKVQIKTPKKSIKQNKCSGLMPVLKIDTINCNGETYLVLPYPPQK